MKKCPNCGALMQSNVNFCTKCGTDLRQVNNSPKEDNRKKQVRHADSQTGGEQQAQQSSEQNGQETNFQQTVPPVKAQTANQGNALVQNYWQWCVNSWKYPFSDTVSENWYGLVTILIDDLLIILGFYFCLKSLANGYNVGGIVSSFAFSGVISLLLFSLLFEAIIIGGYYAGHCFIYGKTEGLLAFINRGVHASNLNLIFSLLVFIFLIMGSNNGSFVSVLLFLIFAIFLMGFQVIALGDNKEPIRDKMYGYLVSFVIIMVALILLFLILYDSISQAILNDLFKVLTRY